MSELQILQHSLGVDEYGRGEQYRNFFGTSEGSTDWPLCNSLVDKGLMIVTRKHRLFNEDVFRVTDKGKEFVLENSPKPPNLSRSKQRYKRYLEYGDCFNSFIEFCRWDANPERSWNIR